MPLARVLNFSLPLLNAQGRGGFGVGLALSYNSQVWKKIRRRHQLSPRPGTGVSTSGMGELRRISSRDPAKSPLDIEGRGSLVCWSPAKPEQPLFYATLAFPPLRLCRSRAWGPNRCETSSSLQASRSRNSIRPHTDAIVSSSNCPVCRACTYPLLAPLVDCPSEFVTNERYLMTSYFGAV